MKKILLASLATLTALGVQAQESRRTILQTASSRPEVQAVQEGTAAKAAGLSAELYYTSSAQLKQVFDTATASRLDQVNPIDSGYIFGMNPRNTSAYAEKYSFGYKTDTTLEISRFRVLMVGTLVSSSTKTFTFNIWNQAAQSAITGFPKWYNEGLPGTVAKTMNVTAKIIPATGAFAFKDTILSFSSALTAVNKNFYIGYSLPTYTWGSNAGDTIGMASSRGGYGYNVGFYNLSGTDSIFLNRNAIFGAGVWKDANWDYGYVRNLSIVPIVRFRSNNIPNSVNGLSHNGLTVFGNYPNPANTSTTVRFSLQASANASVEITDLSGRRVANHDYAALTAGEHRIELPVGDLPAGTYVYTISTSAGDKLAAEMTVVH